MNLKETLSKYSQKPEKLFKKIFINLLFAYMPFVILISILSLFNIVPVNFNEEKVYGIKGAIIMICFSPFIVLMLSAFAYMCFSFGNFVLQVFIAILPDKK